jgi:hypothetical protein
MAYNETPYERIPVMDLKKKFNKAVDQIKVHVPAIIAGASAGAAVILAVANHRLKTEHAAQIEEWVAWDKARDNELHIPEDATERLMKGRTLHLTSELEDFCLILHKHDHPKED